MQKGAQLFHKYFNVLAFVYFVAAIWFFKGDNFFGDAITSTSRLATYIFEQGIYFYPNGFDPGHPPTYSILLAWCWMIFGKTLLVSHIYGITWCVFLFLGFRKVCGLFLDKEFTNYASLLALVHPTFITQNAMMLNTAMLMGCFLWAVYYLISKQKLKLILILCLMMLSHLQGAFFLASLAIADFLINRKEAGLLQFIKTKFVVYSIPFFVFISWLIIHYQHAGWWLIPPDFSDVHGGNSVTQIFKGMFYCAWRFADYGMIVPLVIYLYLKIKHRTIFIYDSLLWITFIVTSIIMSFILKNTIAHRYFLAFELLLLIVVVKEVSIHSGRKVIPYLFILFALIVGNFIYYPGKTIADANIRYRDYFKVAKIVYKELLPNHNMYSKAPLANSMKYISLGNDEIYFQRIEDKIDTLPFVVTSNICAEFTPQENEILSHWYGKSREYGAVYVNYYLNPLYNSKPEGWNLREPGTFEKWVIKMKQKFK